MNDVNMSTNCSAASWRRCGRPWRANTWLDASDPQIPFPVQEVGSWWAHGAQARPERSRRMDVIGVNRADHRVIFGAARWRSTPVTAADLHALMEKGLLWLRGDTARWDIHYAFFARNVGQVEKADLGEENVHLFTPDDITSVHA